MRKELVRQEDERVGECGLPVLPERLAWLSSMLLFMIVLGDHCETEELVGRKGDHTVIFVLRVAVQIL